MEENNKKILNIILSFLVILVILFFLKFLFNKFYYQNNISVKNENFLYIGTCSDFPPYEFKENGNIVGFNIDFICEIAKKLNKEPIIKDIPFENLLLDLKNGNIDVISASLGITDERKKQISFSNPYLINNPESDDNSYILVTLNNDIINSLEDLNGKNIIGIDGYTSTDYVKNILGNKIKFIGFNSSAEGMLALLNNKGFAFIGTMNILELIQKAYPNIVFNIFKIKNSEKLAFGIKKDNIKLLKEINDTLKILIEEGLIEKLKLKWNVK